MPASKSSIHKIVLPRWRDRLKPKLARIQRWLIALKHPVKPIGYRVWQRRFLQGRLQLGLWIALLCNGTIGMINYYQLVLEPDAALVEKTIQFLGDPILYEQWIHLIVISDWVIVVALLLCFLGNKTSWGKRHPDTIFLLTSWSMTLVPEIIGTLMGFAYPGSWSFVFLAQVILAPVRWPLHLIAQLVSVLYFFIVNGVTHIAPLPGISGLFDPQIVLGTFWTCLISILAVYTYDRLQQREFESRRALELFLHTITHDLRTPVLGASIVFQSLLKKAKITNNQTLITTQKLEQLLAGSDRQLSLIDSILEPHRGEAIALSLNCEPQSLSSIVTLVLGDFEMTLSQNQVILENGITDQLPWVKVDGHQIQRVFSNLISNALTHNPAEVQLILGATVQNSRYLRCFVQDHGIGIHLDQQPYLFDLYYRGSHARYAPGVGLGLYVCREIIIAHGGEIGVISQPQSGSTFWFTLPIATVSSNP
jgi:signal transduction histidine kinase